MDTAQEQYQKHRSRGPTQQGHPGECRLCGGDIAHDEKMTDLHPRSIVERHGRNPPDRIGVDDLAARLLVGVFCVHALRPGSKCVGQTALRGVGEHGMGHAVPVWFPSEQSHALFPGFSSEIGLVHRHRHLDAGNTPRQENVFDPPAQFHITEYCSTVKDGLDGAEGESPRGCQFHTGGASSGPFGFAGRKTIDEVAMCFRTVDPQQTRTTGIQEREMGHPLVPA